ncbi:hypothetical protein A2686_04555 [Candidatus Woesebacteria bacterium RIFCSPHIGHO2_01_FULL_38_10]|uniref:Polysaccharide biosynthesis protein C-terminal domain-containing protein n=1 Tax=Candidatus Woesebacteria bacterium RIFCSPLOWO2_01_FULL_39_10b TaxID=1802517 RepID=A0A1F8BAA5_9BACT|nr:MAG: hypothetical protein A2686_04555 [Candidatus Woesebacteria bacterium RIFCSPHIGHO2_01_FULL_38_10]OGM60609.1 MAG: hypothetical protein A2892_01015 [Candidatus Woesebacteria bacterium RIFCSPLOWO2_01_FULL_39_10b]
MREKILGYQFSVLNFSISPREIVKHPLFSGSAVMILGTNITNFIAYLYHLIIGRMLGPATYGELATIISIMGLFFTSFGFLSLVVVKFVSASDEGELGGLFGWFLRISLKIAVFASLLLLVSIPFLNNFLYIDKKILILLAPILFVSSISVVYRALLQGLLKFNQVVVSSAVEVSGRLLLGVLFVFLGFEVFGAVFAIVISTTISFLLLKYFLSKLRLKILLSGFKDGKKVLRYSVAILLGSIATNSIFSSDLVLVKHFFSSYDAGIYASISTLGRVIFFGTSPIASVMFPLVSKRFSRGNAYRKIFFLSFFMVFLMCLSILIIYLLFPEAAIRLLFGARYLEGSKYLFQFGIFMSIFVLASLILNFYLSLEKSKVSIVSVITALVQVVGIWFFHSTINQVINVSIVAASFMFLALAIYFLYGIQKRSVF